MKPGINQWAFPADMPATECITLVNKIGYTSFEVCVGMDGPTRLDSTEADIVAIRKHAENEGIACTFVTRDDRTWLRATERMIGSDIPRREIVGFIHDTEDQRGSGGGGGGNAPGRGARKPHNSRNARSSDSGNANRPQRRKSRSSGRGRSSGGGGDSQPRTR